MQNLTLCDTFVILQNASFFLSNIIIINATVITNGLSYPTVLIENCTFEGSELKIESAANVTILCSHFRTQAVEDDHESNHVLVVQNTSFVFISYTIFGNQTVQEHGFNNRDTMEGTSLGIKWEDVSFAEMWKCNFTRMRSEVKNGSVLLIKNADVLMISCYFYLNKAKHGVIYASGSVNVTTINSSFISNYAIAEGGVFYIGHNCSVTNNNSIYQNNSGIDNMSTLRVYANYI